MVQQSTTRGTQAPVPPIPKMEAGTPGTLTREQIREAVRAQAKAAVAEARAVAQQARLAATQAGAPGTPGNPNPLPPVRDAPQTTSTGFPPGFPMDIPTNAYNLSIAGLVTIAVCVLGFPIVRVLARRFDRRSGALQSGASDVTPQLRTLQDSVDAMAIELERIGEGQRFTSKLLSERAGARVGEQKGEQAR